MKKLITIISIIFIVSITAKGQNIGIGNTNPQSKLDINGDIALRTTDLTISNTYTYALDVNTIKQSSYKLKGSALLGNFILAGITQGVDGRIINLTNRINSSMEIYNEDQTAAANNRIQTGTGGTLAIYPNGTVTLQYDGEVNKWLLKGAHNNSLNYFGSSGSSLPSTAIVLSEIEQNTELQSAGFSLASSILMPTAVQSTGTFSWSFPPSIVNAPSIRGEHTAVWTGTQMLIWGGANPNTIAYYNDGKLYNPLLNTWQSMANTGLNVRSLHTAQWSGTEMLIWGGVSETNTLADGAKYNPQTNSWVPISGTNAPFSRYLHTAVFTGTEMIIWGGGLTSSILRTDHKRYNPTTDVWATISNTNAPAARINHTAVWTDSKMIIYGGKFSNGTITNTGGIYDPITDSWAAISTFGAPPNGLSEHTAIWTGTEMITFGGRKNGGGVDNNFYRYNPITNTWLQGSVLNKPISTIYHSAIWTGERMIVYGGVDGIAGIFNPTTNTWDTQNIANGLGFTKHTSVWTGSSMIVAGTEPAQMLKKDFLPPNNQVYYLYKKN